MKPSDARSNSAPVLSLRLSGLIEKVFPQAGQFAFMSHFADRNLLFGGDSRRGEGSRERGDLN